MGKRSEAVLAATIIREIQKGNPERALESIERFLLRRPGEPALLNLNGVSLDMLGRHEESLSCYEQALSADPAPAAL